MTTISPIRTISVNIGPHQFESPLVLAPMAGISDLPFRSVCVRLGADYAVAEMVASNPGLWRSGKTCRRLAFGQDRKLRVVQIAGAEASWMADAARRAQDLGADIVDVNMGCPAKKVCNRMAGSALLQDEGKVREILQAVCAAVRIPVTLKTRTGWAPGRRNGPRIAKIAEDAGVAAIAVHGRTRECRFRGHAEYDTIAEIKRTVAVPVIANGDIISPGQARSVLEHTGADGLMLGRAACGNPWIFREIKASLTGTTAPPVSTRERLEVMRSHLSSMHAHYGEFAGVRIARKHLGWYLSVWPEAPALRAEFNRIEDAPAQLAFVDGLAAADALGQAA